MEKKDHWEVTCHYDAKVIITACMISNVRSICMNIHLSLVLDSDARRIQMTMKKTARKIGPEHVVSGEKVPLIGA